MSSGKVQVTFAVRADAKDLPLGQPMALVFIASDGELRKLTFLIPCGDAMFTRQRWYWPIGRLKSQIAEEIGAVLAADCWERLLMTDGIQDELPSAWDG